MCIDFFAKETEVGIGKSGTIKQRPKPEPQKLWSVPKVESATTATESAQEFVTVVVSGRLRDANGSEGSVS